eukprot:369563_1
MIQILFCIAIHFIASINGTNFSALADDSLSYILRFVPNEEVITHFRCINQNCNNAFKRSIQNINAFKALLQDLQQQPSHNQTNEIISSISEIHRNQSVMLNELYLLQMPQIINTWYHQMITLHSSANNYTIQRIRQALYLTDDYHDSSINWDSFDDEAPYIKVLVATAREIAIPLMFNHNTPKNPRILFLKLVYEHCWVFGLEWQCGHQDIMPADNYRSSFECLCYSYDDERDDEGIDVQADYIMYLIDTYGFNVFHPKYIETHWNGFSLDVFMELYVSETIWDEYNVDYDDDLMVEFGVRFVIKCLESTNK